MKVKLKLALSSLNAVAVLVLLYRVIQNLTGNLNFGTPKVPLADMTSMADKLQTAISDANEGSKLSRAHRDNMMQQAKVMLSTQATYVTLESAGDAEKLISSGFELAKIPSPIAVPDIPQGVIARTGSEQGEISLQFKHSVGAHNYGMYQSEQDPSLGNATWVLVGNTTRARNVISGLESYKPYWFRVVAIGVSGTSLMSNASQAVAA